MTRKRGTYIDTGDSTDEGRFTMSDVTDGSYVNGCLARNDLRGQWSELCDICTVLLDSQVRLCLNKLILLIYELLYLSVHD